VRVGVRVVDFTVKIFLGFSILLLRARLGRTLTPIQTRLPNRGSVCLMSRLAMLFTPPTQFIMSTLAIASGHVWEVYSAYPIPPQPDRPHPHLQAAPHRLTSTCSSACTEHTPPPPYLPTYPVTRVRKSSAHPKDTLVQLNLSRHQIQQ
jgi:hypothetical protein